MKRFLICLALVASTSAFAGELEDAQALFDKKDYAGAMKIYTRLANAGDPAAQQQLGQMYWYGEAGAVDEAKAKELFEKSAAKGNKVAAESLVVMEQRVTKRAEIDYWIKGYTGADLQSGEYRCPAPRIPAVSKINEEIDRVNKAVTTWQDCYNKMVTNLNAQSPLSKRIPPEIARLMTKQETEASNAYLEQVRQNIAEGAKVNSKMVLADFAAWRSQTEAFIEEHNAVVNKNK